MRTVFALTCTIALFPALLHAQPLSFDPFYVLPAGPGQSSVDLGIDAGDGSDIFNTANVIAMAKFNPHEKIETGAQLAFGWFNDATSNFTHLVVGAKYSLGKHRAATANLTVPAGDVDDPGISFGLMQTLGLAPGLDINTRLRLGLLRGYTGGKGIVVDALVEPAYVVGDRLSAYLTTSLTANTDGFSDALAVNLNPNLDIGIGDGSVVNIGLTFGLAGDAKLTQTALGILLLRAM